MMRPTCAFGARGCFTASLPADTLYDTPRRTFVGLFVRLFRRSTRSSFRLNGSPRRLRRPPSLPFTKATKLDGEATGDCNRISLLSTRV